ncbi:hypothetical protein BVI2075_1060004 [Burkholderia vietnamiensis]|nr:hypothetical protein BVI2075_1060004 [Burkholderia vietnamiensis]
MRAPTGREGECGTKTVIFCGDHQALSRYSGRTFRAIQRIDYLIDGRRTLRAPSLSSQVPFPCDACFATRPPSHGAVWLNRVAFATPVCGPHSRTGMARAPMEQLCNLSPSELRTAVSAPRPGARASGDRTSLASADMSPMLSPTRSRKPFARASSSRATSFRPSRRLPTRWASI